MIKNQICLLCTQSLAIGTEITSISKLLAEKVQAVIHTQTTLSENNTDTDTQPHRQTDK